MTSSPHFSKVSWAVLCGFLAVSSAVAPLFVCTLEAHAGEVTILHPPQDVFRTSAGGTLILSLGQSDAESLVALLRRRTNASFMLGGIRVVDATPEGATTVRGRAVDGSEIIIVGIASF